MLPGVVKWIFERNFSNSFHDVHNNDRNDREKHNKYGRNNNNSTNEYLFKKLKKH